MIRKAKISDVPEIGRLVNFYAEKGEMLPRPLSEIYERVRDFSLYELDGKVVGTCALSIYDQDLAEIRSLAVWEKYEGQGIGTSLTKACLDEAASLGIKRVFALTYKPGFFERLGFRIIDKMELPQKIWRDCLQCAKFPQCDEFALIREVS